MVATIATQEGLKIPVFDAAYTDAKGRNVGKFFNNPEILRHSILQAIFQPEELNSLMIVKLDKSNPDPHQLRASIHDPEDGIKRRMIFQSGNSYYFGDETLAKKIGDLFVTEKDTACRYGSLLVSTCMSGVSECDNLRVKIVDFTDPQYAKYRTGDCHGAISSELLKSIGGEKNRASQFRFAWLRSWNSENTESTPQVSFLAKGTLRPDDNLLDSLADSEGNKPQLILDRSSIKGINKNQLKKLIPCGDYELPKAILGNRKNSQIGITQTSWQSTGVWFDEAAQKQDLVPAAKTEAQRLATLQRDPMKLRQAMIEDYDKREAYLARLNERKLKEQQDKLSTTIDDEINGDNEESTEDKKRERQDIQMLKADKFGLMIGSPEFTNMAERWLASKWRNLATRGALSMTSAMALPCEDLPRGTVCAHHLEEGECVQGRFPILNKDGLRIYQNVHAKNLENIPEETRAVMAKIKGVIWFNPKDLEKFHQGDFDGDEPFGIESGKLPHIAQQILPAQDGLFDFGEVVQAEKIPYTKAKYREDDPEVREGKVKAGDRKFTTLEQIGVASSQNEVGIVALAIGKVAAAIPNPGEDEKLFLKQQKRFIAALSIMEQYEVDYQKNSLRGKDAKEVKEKTGLNPHTLLEKVDEWCEKHKSCTYFFQYKGDDRLYKQFPMPADFPNAVYVLAKEAVNPYWEQTRLIHRNRDEFQHILPPIPAHLIVSKDHRKELDAAGIKYEKEGKELHVFYEYKNALVERGIEYRHSKENDLPWEENELQWAKDMVQRFQEDKSIIYDRTGSDIKARKEEMGKLYDSYRAEIEEIWDTPDRKTRAAHALFQATHTSDNLSKHRTICQKVAENLEITFSLQEDYELLHEALPRDVYVLQVPFQKVKTKDGRTIDLPNQWKDALDSKGIEYEATAHPELPLVEFAFKNLPQSMVAKLDAKYGDNSNDRIDTDSLKVTNYSGNETRLLIVPPVDCRWIESQDKAGRGALVYKLFMDEISDALSNYRVNQIEVVNVKHPDNDYSEEDFSKSKWKDRKVTLQVGTIDLPPTHEKYYRFQGTPIIQLDGKNLGTFSPESPKLPPGTTFEATLSPDKGGRSVMLKVDRESIRLPEIQLPSIDSPEVSQTSDLAKPAGNAIRSAIHPNGIAQNSSTYQPPKFQQESASKPETAVNNGKCDTTNAKADNWRLSLQDTLFSVVSETYKQRRSQLPSDSTQHFKFGDNQWTAYVQPNGDCFVRNESKRTVFKANVHTGEVQIPLTEQAAARFQEMIVEREKTLSQSRTTLAPATESKPRELEMV
ncbi:MULTISPECIES: hypothetical protein [unclassified Microcoleus]|uniref:hypothetical protein n=1 Tax=unclassified Microcoleus TaxID=2642155 RepID=UPI002FCFDF38